MPKAKRKSVRHHEQPVNGYQKLYKRVDTRLPISHDLLEKILNTLNVICYSSFESSLFSASFCLAYFGFFRVGELVVSNIGTVDHALHFGDLSVDSETIKIFLRSSKTDQFHKGVEIMIPKTESETCPLKHMLKFLRLRRGINCKYLSQPNLYSS